MNRILIRLVPALLLAAALSALPAQAADPAVTDYCAKNPDTCTEAAERIRQRCADNPTTCEKATKRAQDLKVECAADPAACEEKKEQLRERRDILEAKCDADPAVCEEKKQKFRDKLQQYRRHHVSRAGETPPTIPPRPSR